MDSYRDDQTGDDDADDELKDQNFGGKDAILFVIDASPAMHVRNIKNKDNDDVTSPFEMSLRCIHTTLRNKIFGSPSDLVGVLFFGTRDKIGVRDFDNLSVFLPFAVAEGKSILKVEEHLLEYPDKFDREFGSVDKFHLHEALWECQNMFNDVIGKTAMKKILLFTSNDDPHGNNEGLKIQAFKKGGDLAGTGIILELLPVGNPSFDVKKFYFDLLPEDDEDGLADLAAQKFDDLMSLVKKRVHKKRAVGRIKFNLGGDLQLGVSIYSFVQRAYKPSKVRLTGDTNEEVKISRQLINPTTGAPLLPSDINKYQEYGGKKIKFTMDETKSLMAMDGLAGLKLLAFKSRDELRWHHFVRHAHFIYPDENSIKGSRTLFAALLMRCIARNVVAICSMKQRDASQPNFVALVPHLEKSDTDGPPIPKGFLVFYLPFADDLRNLPDVNFVSTDEEELELAKKIIKKLKLKRFEPEAFENPDLQSHYRLIESLALQQDDVEPVNDLTMPPKDKMDKKLGPLAEQFNTAFVKKGDLCSEAKKKPYYNPNVPSWQKKTAKTQPVKSEAGDSFDVSEYVKNNSVEKLTVDKLKSALTTMGVAINSKMKKADLVDLIYKNFKD